LWIGGLFESEPNEDNSNRKNKGVFGETFTCLFAMQMLDLKRGDRYFYENAPSQSKGTSKIAFSIGIIEMSYIPYACKNLCEFFNRSF
jgi:hypothetical protein